jgi:methionyl-tRNA synthetase
MSAERFYITTPIYYVNDVPHLGHAYTTIAADAMSRFHRMRGVDVFFLTGTDEHGQKVAQAAAARGLTEQEHCDELHQNFRALWRELNISNDAFIRTTDPEHKEQVQAALQKLWEDGFVYEQDYEGWYNVSDEMFVTDPDEIEQLKAAGRVEFVKESNYFFKMSAFQDQLLSAIESGELAIEPDTRRNEILGFLRQKLGDLSISRPKTRLSWGIELPFAPDHVCYVWVDALLNYCTALRYLNPGTPADASYAPFWPADYHLIGKDILTTHSVYWTTLLMALGLPLPRHIFAHGWWTFEGGKMSKSMGNVVDPNLLIAEFGADPLRYFVLRQMTFGQDGDFAAGALVERLNSDLANDLGNLASRVLNLVDGDGGHFAEGTPTVATQDVIDEFEAAAAEYESAFAACGFSAALRRLWDVLGAANKLIQDTEPWRLRKERDDDPAAGALYDEVMRTSGSILLGSAALLFPVMPERMQALWAALGGAGDLGDFRYPDANRYMTVSSTATVTKGAALFPRIKAATVPSFTERAEQAQ